MKDFITEISDIKLTGEEVITIAYNVSSDNDLSEEQKKGARILAAVLIDGLRRKKEKGYVLNKEDGDTQIEA